MKAVNGIYGLIKKENLQKLGSRRRAVKRNCGIVFNERGGEENGQN